MKFIVDELPYYGDPCPFEEVCCDAKLKTCPRVWDKYEACRDGRKECQYLIELPVNLDNLT